MRILSGAALALIFVGACSDSTKPVDPAMVAGISLTPAAIPLVKGSRTQLTLSARDSAGNDINVNATWTSNSPSVARVSNEGAVTAMSFGLATITATVGTHSATAGVLVTTAPTERAYAVTDLGGALAVGGMTRQLSDSGGVLAGGRLYRGGTAIAMTGCTTPVTINGPGHVLCRLDVLDSISSYAIWHDGALTPLAAADTFKAEHFRAFAMDDADEVAGLLYNPAFTNAKCATPGARCLSIWKSGTVTFPGFNAGAELMLMNNVLQVVLQDPIYAEYHSSDAVVYDVSTGTQRSTPWGVQSLNDKGLTAIAQNWVHHGGANSGTLGSLAQIATTDRVIVLGAGTASGINNSDVVVGTLDFGPFLWSESGGVSLLTRAAIDPQWTITAADEINNRGQILATADNSDGRKARTVLLTPAQP